MERITNIIIDNGKWKERYLLPGFRKEHDRLLNEAIDTGDERAIAVCGRDDIWWNDDIIFMIERMADADLDNENRYAACAVDHIKWTPGQSIIMTIGGVDLKMIADTSDVSDGYYKFL